MFCSRNIFDRSQYFYLLEMDYIIDLIPHSLLFSLSGLLNIFHMLTF